MGYVDVFNGDADGICALQQLRLAEPAASTLVTGVKRDIELLGRVQAGQGDEITVLDISLDKNREALVSLLDTGARVRYFDHHYAGDIPEHPNLSATIDTAADTCTSLLVDAHLQGRHRAWAVAGAFGDNFDGRAREAAAGLDLSEAQIEQLRELGICINYNGYGAGIEDLFFPPDELFRRLQPYASPLEFIARDEAFQRLSEGYAEDTARAQALAPELADAHHALYVLPAESWARRVSGVFANQLARQAPERAHAMLTHRADGGYVVSVRAPLANKSGADALCREFPTGGGRQAAAGINNLPEADYEAFVARFRESFL